MKKPSLILAALLGATVLPALQGCFPVVATGVAVGVMSAHDRRSTGVQTDDETSEWKARNRIPAQYASTSNVSFISYNRALLITGQVPSEDAKAAIGQAAGQVEGVKTVYNELVVGPVSSLSSRSTDAYVTSKVKARLVDAKQVSANHIKVDTEQSTVYLMGIVSEREAKAAIQIARTTDGVRKVVNLFEVLSDAEIQRLDALLAGSKTAPRPAPVESR